MKLITIKPIIFETSTEDDPFAERPEATGPALLNYLQNKSSSLQHEMKKLTHKRLYVIDETPGAVNYWSYPGGYSVADAEIRSGKLIKFGSIVLPNTPENQRMVQRVEEMEQRAANLGDVKRKLDAKITRLANSEATKQLTVARSGSTQTQIPATQIPFTIDAGGYQTTNPYYQSTKDRYAGDPKFFPWKPAELQQYLKLNEILTTNGLGEFTTMYASVVIKIGGSIPRLNFIVVGANTKFAWHRYGKSNWANKVYINGSSRYTDLFLDEAATKPKQLKRLIASMKTP